MTRAVVVTGTGSGIGYAAWCRTVPGRPFFDGLRNGASSGLEHHFLDLRALRARGGHLLRGYVDAALEGY
jgi:hypothetical protein